MHELRLIQHWIAVHLGFGFSHASLFWYSVWSGFMSDLGEYALVGTLGAGLLHTVSRTNCQVGGTFPHGCKLPALHTVEVDGIMRRVCHKHSGHPVLHHNNEIGLHHEIDQESGSTGSDAAGS